MNKKDWFSNLPLTLSNEEIITVQCRNCKDFFKISYPPSCPECKIALDLCQHGLACLNCSYSLLLKWIKEGNLKQGDLPTEQLTEIKKTLKEKKTHN